VVEVTGVRLSEDWRNPGWTQVPTDIVRDSSLSLKALGLVAYLASHEPGFRLTREFIVRSHKDGRESVESGLRELREARYLTVEQARDEKGRLADGSDYVLHRVPMPVTPETRDTDTVTPKTRMPENPDAGKPATKKTILKEDQKKDLPDAAAPDGLASEAKEPTINQRANVIAGAHYERLGKMGNVPAFAKIIKQALTAGRLDADVDQACAWIAENHWTLTAERLANVLAGGPKLPGRPVPKPIGNTGAVMTADEAEAWLLERYHAGAAEEVAARTGRTYEAPHPKSVPPGMDPAEFQLADRKQWIKYYRRGLMCVLMGQPFRNGTEVEGV
jgi:hypothetical protein